jgi:hypothetical protein
MTIGSGNKISIGRKNIEEIKNVKGHNENDPCR